MNAPRPKWPYELFGVECGPGWGCLVWPLLRRCRLEDVSVLQVKEKFGGLRFYTGPASDELLDAINDAESLSFEICEICGEPGRIRGGSWLRTLCDEHAPKEQSNG